MKMAQTFEAARPAAQHCDELTMQGPRPEERDELLSAWRRDLGKTLSEGLGGLLSGGKVVATVSEAQWLVGEQVFEKIDPVAANCLLRCGAAEQTLLLSIDLATAVALTDRSFGGSGNAPESSPEQLPRSAGLLVDQAAAIVAGAIVAASGDQTIADGDVIIRSESAARLKPFGLATPCAAFVIEFGEPDGPSWKALIGVERAVLDSLLPGMGAAPRSPGSSSGPSDAGATPFGAIPLSIEAVLAEFDMTLGRLEKLAPGDRIAISVPRDVPLRIGSHAVGGGSVGTFEDRMAIRLTRINQGASIR
ncbi:MAG: FliM/FliN family flagellar motor C-terminal domain-containing protein [Erythrobacter sp.]|nr:FliM/FliN family flagellar motor C-terminal domain-containing protein [Erythrobacter sp.]